MLVNSAFFKNQSITAVFPSRHACFSVDLDRNISRISLDSTVFSYSFFFLRRNKNLLFAKISSYSRNTIFLARKHKNTQKLVRLMYAMFLSELPPLSFPKSNNTLLG